jgi:hypothetical protein
VRFFSVGDGAADDVVGVVVLDGLGVSLPLQPAVNAPMAMIALPPATSASRRAKRPEVMILLSYLVRGHPWGFADDRVIFVSVNIVAHFEQTTARNWKTAVHVQKSAGDGQTARG